MLKSLRARRNCSQWWLIVVAIGNSLGVWCAQVPHTALALGIASQGTSSPFDVDVLKGGNLSGLIIQVVNQDATTDTVLSWQLDLNLVPVGVAAGTLTVTGVSAPPDSMFGSSPGPMQLETLPDSRVHIFDADYSSDFSGVTVASGSARNILQLDISASDDASGTFQLLMADLNPMETEDGSSWFPADSGDPAPFDNTTPGALSATRLLGTFHINASVPGDYDGDGKVTASDYDRWRSIFGNIESVPGAEADGDHDGVVDASDYVVWRESVFTQGLRSAVQNEKGAVPEPIGNATILVTVAICLGRFTCRWRPNSAQA